MSESIADLVKESTRLQKEKSGVIMDILRIQTEQIQELASRICTLEKSMVVHNAERSRRIWDQFHKEEE